MTLKEEIEYAHRNRSKDTLIRNFDLMRKIVLSATNTYTNLSLFWNDYVGSKDMSRREKLSAYNDLYLLALLHISEDDFNVIMKELENEK